MKNNTVYTVIVYTLLIVGLLSVSCHKINTDDFRHKLQNGNADLRQCVIREIGSDSPEVFSRRVFVYNERKDPVSATPAGIATGSPQWLFFYDKKGRLIQFIGIYNDTTSFEFWHKYFYDNQDRIIGDSVYDIGNSSHFDESVQLGLITFTYDHLNRIIEKSISIRFTPINNSFSPPPPINLFYSYNAAGNASEVAFDNKLNPSLTNKIWRFLNNDYSINNSLSATAYNEHGFPLHFSNSFESIRPETFLPGQGYAGASIQYDCKDGADMDHGGPY
ncbi:MAG TPA: hypothetical protein VE035_08805 [Puia sp.]|nr:hypothetical protein [Puia sp.]